MPSHLRFALLFLATAGAAFAAGTQLATDKPIINFRVPEFTPEGNRAWLVRGTEARYISENLVDVKELNLSVFTGQPDGKVETLILSPSAEIRVGDLIASGHDTIRVINDRFDASGSEWVYAHKEKKVSIARNVHVVLHTQLKDLLK